MIEVRSGLESDAVLTAEIKAASKQESLARIASEFPFPLLRVSRDGHMLFANAHGINLARQAKIKLGDLIPKDWRAPLQRAVEGGEAVNADWSIDGKFYSLAFVNAPESHYVSIFVRDMSDDYREEYRDPLTGLANRVLFLDRLRQVVSLALRNEQQVAVHVIRFQHFKGFADTLGHGTADGYLCKIAERLNSTIRTSDTVARLSHNEFAVIQVEPKSREGVKTAAKKLQTAMENPIAIAGERLLCRSHIGISVFPDDAESPEDLLRNALLALDQEIQMGEMRYRFFMPPMKEKMDRRWAIEDDLERAIRDEDFTVLFQPKQELSSGRLSGMEALVRWNHREYGELSPEEFIPVAERSRLILPLGAWVMQKSCQVAKNMHDLDLGPLKVAVNLSSLQFSDQGIVESIRSVLDETGLRPEFLELEITETIAMKDAISANETFKEIANLGVSISIDDFGTGYSSLAYLKSFQVQRIKIDKLFIDDIGSDAGVGSIARAVTTMGHSFGMDVTAEGVSTVEQVAFLRRLECDEIQGDYLSPPLNADAFEAFVRGFEPPHHYVQGVLNWSSFKDAGDAHIKSSPARPSLNADERLKDERRSSS